MMIAQDPADTTPHHTGRLCAVHNAQNKTDKSAQQGLQLWNAAVSLKHDNPQQGGYMRKNYWTNAMMHGVSRSRSDLRERVKAARICCSNVLALQAMALRPNVVIAQGVEAVNSLHEIGVIKNDWPTIRHNFKSGAYHENVPSWRGLPQFKAFCTYLSSANVVNRTLSKSYDPVETEGHIRRKTERLNSQQSIDQFLSIYGNPENNIIDRCMRFLLNHWLDFGPAIRAD